MHSEELYPLSRLHLAPGKAEDGGWKVMNNCDAMPEVFCWRPWCHLSPYSHFKQAEQSFKELNGHQGATSVNGDSIKCRADWEGWCLRLHGAPPATPATLSTFSESQGRSDLTYSSCHYWRSWNKDLSGSIRGNSFLICLLQRRAEEQGQAILPEPSDTRKQKEERKIYPCCLCNAVIVNMLSLHNREKPNGCQTLTNQTSFPLTKGGGK